MHLLSADFITSAAKPEQFLKRPIPHIVFAGRSNVGKSSILNKLVKRKSLAKTSGTPGKTRLVNYFLINDQFFFIDLPGYGYAKVSKTERAQWKKLIESYLTQTPQIHIIFQLIDIRHDPSREDLLMLEWLRHYNYPYKIILTKSDKLSKNQVARQQSHLAKILQIDRESLIATSSTTGQGVPQVWSHINDVLQKPQRLEAEKRDAL